MRAAPRHPALDALHQYLDCWRGASAGAAGKARQNFDLQLTQYAERAGANFYPSGLAHSVMKGTEWTETPWRARLTAAGP